jgi:hypothetical protein
MGDISADSHTEDEDLLGLTGISHQEILDIGKEPASCLCRRRIDHNLYDNGVQGIAVERRTTDKWTLIVFLLLCVGVGVLSWYVSSSS